MIIIIPAYNATTQTKFTVGAHENLLSITSTTSSQWAEPPRLPWWMSTLKTTPSSKCTTIGLDPLLRYMALMACGSTPLGIFTRISGNDSRGCRSFCIGEVFEDDPASASKWQGAPRLYSKLPFAQRSPGHIPGPQNISGLETAMTAIWDLFKDAGLLGNFLVNQDVLRWANMSVDPQSL